MNFADAFRKSFLTRTALGAMALAASLLASPSAFAQFGGGAGSVNYNIPEQIQQGNMPYTASYTLLITSPSGLPAGNYTIGLNLTLLATPGNISTSQALSFVTISSNTSLLGVTNLLGSLVGSTQVNAATVSFTGPNQMVAVTVTTNIPLGNWAGGFGYEIQTSGWPANLGVTDQGAFINDTVAQSSGTPSVPSIQFTAPTDGTQYTWVANGPAVIIPYSLVGKTPDGSPILAMNGSVNGQNLGVAASGLNLANTTVTANGNYSVSAPGRYTFTANDANANGVGSATVQITVNVQAGPPSVVINTPAANSTYLLTGNEVDVPFTFTGTSQYGGITNLTATLDGKPISVSSGNYGNLVALGVGTLPFTSVGNHTLSVTATDNFGTATTSENLIVAPGSVINLGAAAGFSILTYNNSNNSDSAFQGGNIGVVKGNWAQSGGQQTNNQQPTTVYLSTGYTNKGPAVESTVINGTLLNAAWTAATNESATLAALKPTATLASINANQANTTITETVVGNYVFNIANISLNHPASLVISAPAGSTVVLNISGSMQLNGGTDGGWVVLAGGLTSANVIYNFTGTGSVLHTAGGGNGSFIQGNILAPRGQVQLDPGQVNGEIIAQTFSTSSGTLVLTGQ